MMFDFDSPQSRTAWHNAEFLNDLYHIVHHKDLVEYEKMIALRMLIDREYKDRLGDDK